MDALFKFSEVIFLELWRVIGTLGIPIVLFFSLALIVKGKNSVKDFYASLDESMLNFKLLLINTVFLIPFVVFYRKYAVYMPTIDPAIWADVPSYLVIFIAVFAGDFIGYWRHRLEHSRWLWPFHAVHHSDTQMSWFTLERFHPVNRLTTFFIDNLFLISLGLPIYAIVAKNFVRHYYGYFIHADLPWTYGKVLSYIFVSPAMHRWHHAMDEKAFNTNYATVFSCFDRWFGTYRVPGVCNIDTGVVHEMDLDLKGQLFYGFHSKAYK